MSERIVVAGAIIDGRGLLLAQRDRPVEVAGLWELPGGKVEFGESDATALQRELREELGVDTAVGAALAERVALPAGLTLIALRVRIVDGEPSAIDHRALRWVDATELDQMTRSGELVPADTAWVPELLAILAETPSGP